MTIPYNSGLIRAIRGLLNLEQEDMASLADVSKRTYIEAERGRACSATTWEAILKAGEAKGVTIHTMPGGIVLHISEALTDTLTQADKELSNRYSEKKQARKNAGPTHG